MEGLYIGEEREPSLSFHKEGSEIGRLTCLEEDRSFQFSLGGEEVLRITREKMIVKGEEVQDAGKVYEEFLPWATAVGMVERVMPPRIARALEGVEDSWLPSRDEAVKELVQEVRRFWNG